MVHRDLLAILIVLIDGPNARVLINCKLPPEILLQIFNHVRLEPCKHGTPGASVWNPTAVHLDRLIRLSHVCRYWRDIILSTPTLWDRIDDARRHWKRVELASQRAHGIPLFLSAAYEPSHPMRQLWKGTNIRELRYAGIALESAKYHLRARAPSLENLSLSGS